MSENPMMGFGARANAAASSADKMRIAKRYPTFTLENTRRFRPLLQLRIRDGSGRRIALEFRPRDRNVGRELASALGTRRELPQYT